MCNGWDNKPVKKIKAKIKINLSQNFEIRLCLRYLKLYIKKIKAKEDGVNIPNSFRKNPETYDPKIPNKFLFSVFDTVSHPVSLKLNDNEDKIINNDVTKKIIPNKVNKNFFLKVRLEIYSLSYIIIFFKVIWYSF